MWCALSPCSLADIPGEGGGESDSTTRCSGDSEHRVVETPAPHVRQITLTLPSPGVPGEGSCRARAIALKARLIRHVVGSCAETAIGRMPDRLGLRVSKRKGAIPCYAGPWPSPP